MLLARSTGGKGERVYLTDFGIARLRDDGGHLTQTGTFTATLAYASPEQLTGAELDGRADQYSLACSLFWLFTGTGPFAATNPAAVIRGHLQEPPPPLSTVRPGLPPGLDAVLAKAMAKRPDDRFANCADFAVAARRALATPSSPGVPVMPRQYTGPGMQTVGPQMGAPVTGTGPGNPVVPPRTGTGIPNAGPMQTSGPAPMPTMGPGPMPMTGVRSPTPPPQPMYPQNSPYAQRGGFGGYQPAPMPPQRKSNTGLIIGIIIGAVVILLIVLAIIGSLG
jgi:serine/threonine-protein kinase